MRAWIVIALTSGGCVVSEGVGDPFATDGARPGAAPSADSPWEDAAPRGLTMAARLPLVLDQLVLQPDGLRGHAIMASQAISGGDGVYTCAFTTVTGDVTDDRDLSDFGGFEGVVDAGWFDDEETTVSVTDDTVSFLEHVGDGAFRVGDRLALEGVAGVAMWNEGWVGLRDDGYGDCQVERYLERASQPAEVHTLDGVCGDRPDIEVSSDGKAWFVHGDQVYSWTSGSAPVVVAAGRSVAWTGRGVAVADPDGVRIVGRPLTRVDGRVRQVLAVGRLPAYLAVGARVDGSGAVWLVDARDGSVVDTMFLPDARGSVAAARDVGLFAVGGQEVTLIQVGL